MRNKKVTPELIAAVYNDLKNNHLGRENAVARREYAEGCGISEREMRVITHEINENKQYEGIVSTSGCLYMCGTKEECIKAIGTSFRSAFTLMRKATRMRKKVEENGQYRLDANDNKLIVSYFFPPEQKGGTDDEAVDLEETNGDTDSE